MPTTFCPRVDFNSTVCTFSWILVIFVWLVTTPWTIYYFVIFIRSRSHPSVKKRYLKTSVFFLSCCIVYQSIFTPIAAFHHTIGIIPRSHIYAVINLSWLSAIYITLLWRMWTVCFEHNWIHSNSKVDFVRLLDQKLAEGETTNFWLKYKSTLGNAYFSRWVFCGIFLLMVISHSVTYEAFGGVHVEWRAGVGFWLLMVTAAFIVILGIMPDLSDIYYVKKELNWYTAIAIISIVLYGLCFVVYEAHDGTLQMLGAILSELLVGVLFPYIGTYQVLLRTDIIIPYQLSKVICLLGCNRDYFRSETLGSISMVKRDSSGSEASRGPPIPDTTRTRDISSVMPILSPREHLPFFTSGLGAQGSVVRGNSVATAASTNRIADDAAHKEHKFTGIAGLRKLFAHEEALNDFAQYLKKEYSIENLIGFVEYFQYLKHVLAIDEVEWNLWGIRTNIIHKRRRVGGRRGTKQRSSIVLQAATGQRQAEKQLIKLVNQTSNDLLNTPIKENATITDDGTSPTPKRDISPALLAAVAAADKELEEKARNSAGLPTAGVGGVSSTIDSVATTEEEKAAKEIESQRMRIHPNIPLSAINGHPHLDWRQKYECLFLKYIASDSDFEINLSYTTRKQITGLRKMLLDEKLSMIVAKEDAMAVVTGICDTTLHLLQDSLLRYQQTDSYFLFEEMTTACETV